VGTYISRRVLRDDVSLWAVIAMAEVTFQGTDEARSVSSNHINHISKWVPIYLGVSREIMYLCGHLYI